MVTSKKFFVGLPANDLHTHMSKVNNFCMSSVGRTYLDKDSTGLIVFPHSLTSDATIWLFELPYNLITTWNELHTTFIKKYCLLSQKLNLKDRIDKFK